MKKTCKADLSSIRKILDEVGIAEGQTDIESYKWQVVGQSHSTVEIG